MAQGARFCGNCGAALQTGARFCGECGWQLPATHAPSLQVESSAESNAIAAPRRSDRQAVSAAQPVRRRKPEPIAQASVVPDAAPPEPVASGAGATAVTATIGGPWHIFFSALEHGLKWAPIWALGWAPVGTFMGTFYGTRSPIEILSHTIPGATAGFAAGGLAGGVVAGAILKWLMPDTRAIGVARAFAVLGLWLGGFALALAYPAATFYTDAAVDDGTCFGLILIAAPLIAAIGAWVTVRLTPQAEAAGVGAVKRRAIGAGWVFAAFIALIVMAAVIDI